MIDIHSHIVFDVDDGPDTLEESLELIAESYRQGVRTIVSTSHRRKGMFETPEDVIFHNFSIVKEEAERIYPDLTILFGGELYYTFEIPDKLMNGQVPFMNGTRFALIEFSMNTRWQEIQEAISKLLMVGVTPIIAHIERYNALEFNEERVRSLIDKGCYMQVNSLHVLKPKMFGDKYKVFKKRVAYFLKHKLVHIVSSDMHNTDQRPPYMDQAYGLVVKEYGQRTADKLFHDNAATLLENKYL